MGFVADGMGVRPGGRDEKIERLHTSVPGSLGHDIEQLSVRLGVKLIEHNTVDIESVLGIRLGG